MMITDPGLNCYGTRLLYRARLHARQNGRAYPLALDIDRRGLDDTLAGGYLVQVNDDPHLVSLTEKGEAFLDKLMRAE
ncbi:hypothetical protein [Rhizobium sp. S96]|uniref:hypothetical protein n=1 Tax=Rhizobium sp. S96 TaxID=3055140 RepID=UPI0025AA3BBE|nr:hypothetical protein [Rhizobium sp. S96]MDM9619097.1 hypothetical protein [Rhizobium sp. S96]